MSENLVKRTRPGVGMPASLHLDRFGEVVDDYFGVVPMLVGSAATGTGWRDVDVRLILDDDEYRRFVGDPTIPYHESREWRALTLAFSALGHAMTGLPIDFQIQRQVFANEHYKGLRHALMVVNGDGVAA